MFNLITFSFFAICTVTLCSGRILSDFSPKSFIEEVSINHMKNATKHGILNLTCDPGYLIWTKELIVPSSMCEKMGFFDLIRTALFGIGFTMSCDLRPNCSINLNIPSCSNYFHSNVQAQYMCKKQVLTTDVNPQLQYAIVNKTGFIDIKCDTGSLIKIHAGLNWAQLLDNCKSEKEIPPFMYSVTAKIIYNICDDKQFCAMNMTFLEEFCPNYFIYTRSEYVCERQPESIQESDISEQPQTEKYKPSWNFNPLLQTTRKVTNSKSLIYDDSGDFRPLLLPKTHINMVENPFIKSPKIPFVVPIPVMD